MAKEVTQEKLTWLQQHLVRGDKAQIAKETNVGYALVVDILKGKLWGEHGAIVIAATEKLLNARKLREAKERRKFAQMNENHG